MTSAEEKRAIEMFPQLVELLQRCKPVLIKADFFLAADVANALEEATRPVLDIRWRDIPQDEAEKPGYSWREL